MSARLHGAGKIVPFPHKCKRQAPRFQPDAGEFLAWEAMTEGMREAGMPNAESGNSRRWGELAIG